MTSPSQRDPIRRTSASASPRTGLLPSPFSHSDEAVQSQDPPRRGSLDPPRQGSLDPPRRTSLYSPDPEPPLDEEDDEYLEAQDGELLPPQGFQPFFTMMQDAESGETYHPATYYVFADDEPDVLSTAAMHALDNYSPHARREAEAHALAEGRPREEERFAVLTLNEEGNAVVSAKSLSADWAVVDATVRAAPTFDGGEDGDGAEGLMLMVQGLGVGDEEGGFGAQRELSGKERMQRARNAFDDARRKGGGSAIGGMEELMQGLAGGMGTLEKVVSLG